LQEEIEKAKQAAFRLLSYRIRSCQELADKLKEKGFSKEVVKTVVKDLKRIDYLNDSDFSKEFVESRLIHNPKGKKLLRYELIQKGVESKIIDKVIEEKIPPEKEENIAKVLARKVWNRKKGLEENKRKMQTYNYLARRGFPISLIVETIKKLQEKQ
jgi:regulatory protein